MKSLWICVCMCFFMAVTGNAQISLRPQIGVNFASFNYESIHGSIKGRTGLHIGADMQFGNTFYVQPGMHFSTTKLQIRNFGDVKISRMHIPIMVGLRILDNDEGILGLRVFAGPDFAFSVKETIAEQFTDLGPEDFENFQISGIIGAGADIGIFFVDIGYKFGMTEYLKTEIAEQNVNFFIGNAGFRIGF